MSIVAIGLCGPEVGAEGKLQICQDVLMWFVDAFNRESKLIDIKGSRRERGTDERPIRAIEMMENNERMH